MEAPGAAAAATAHDSSLAWLLRRSLEDSESSDDDDRNHAAEVAAEVLSNVFLFFLIFGMSATVDTKKIMTQLRNRFAILTGVTMQFLIMPFLGYLAVKMLEGQGLTQPMAISLLIVTASPGGSYSNWWCSIFNADLALSVAMTAISTICSTFLLPANLLLYGYAVFGFDRNDEDNIVESVDFVALFIALAIVIVAILSGLFASFKFHTPKFQRAANRVGSIAGVLLIVSGAVIALTTGDDEASIADHPFMFYFGVAFPCLVGLALSNMFSRLARLSYPEVVTISVECCYQNVGIATSAAVTMFDDPQERAEALFVPLFYGVVEAVVLGIYCIVAWKLGWTKAPADEKFCVVVTHTYEVDDEDDDERSDDEQSDDEHSDDEQSDDGVRLLHEAEASDAELAQTAPNPEPCAATTTTEETTATTTTVDDAAEETTPHPTNPVIAWIVGVFQRPSPREEPDDDDDDDLHLQAADITDAKDKPSSETSDAELAQIAPNLEPCATSATTTTTTATAETTAATTVDAAEETTPHPPNPVVAWIVGVFQRPSPRAESDGDNDVDLHLQAADIADTKNKPQRGVSEDTAQTERTRTASENDFHATLEQHAPEHAMATLPESPSSRGGESSSSHHLDA